MFTQRDNTLSLNGEWYFVPDPMQRGMQQKWWKNERPENQLFPCWDFDGMWRIQVPSTWCTAFEKLAFYEGYACYVKDFTCDELPEGEDAFLCFDGANYTAEIWINGIWVGKHQCGYSPFQYRITPLLQKQNRIMVYVENLRKEDRVPGMIYDWHNDGGIIRPVKIVFAPEKHIENFQIRTALEGDEVVIAAVAWFTSRDERAEETITITIPELGLSGEERVYPGEKTFITFRIPKEEVSLWAPGNPKLYTVEVSCGEDIARDEVGLREIKTRGQEILLNDEPIKLWGLATHSEFKHMGRADTPELLDEFFTAIHDLGCNFVRCAHYPFSDAFVRKADQEGILLWEEVPAYWQVRMYEPEVMPLAFQMMREMIDRDLNRASVIIWSVSNECEWKNPEGDDGNWRYGIECAQLVRDMDPTRLISSAETHVLMNDTPWNPAHADDFSYEQQQRHAWRPSLPDEYYAAMDILAMNNYADPGVAEVDRIDVTVRVFAPYNKPLMMSEFGSVSLRGVEGNGYASESFHAQVARNFYDSIEAHPTLAGAAIWNFCDIRSPIQWQWFGSGLGVFRYGLTDENWQPKAVYQVVKEFCRKHTQQMAEK
ncbi:MAG: glycoside hydrolase family 2 protein [Armatimonadota bacterium]